MDAGTEENQEVLPLFVCLFVKLPHRYPYLDISRKERTRVVRSNSDGVP